MKLYSPLRAILYGSIFLFTIWLAGYGYFVYHITHLIPPAASATKPDAIIVVTGGSQRINKGLDLLQAGYTDNLFISGVHKKVTLTTIFDMWDGYDGENPVCCVSLGHAARNTWENALEARLWINAQDNVQTLWLITSNYHMPRAWVELHAAMPEMTIIAYPVDSDITMNEQGGFFRVSLREYNKTILTYIRLNLVRIEEHQGSII